MNPFIRTRRAKKRLGSTPLRGPEFWKTVEGVPFCHWDLWLLAVAYADGGLDQLIARLMERHRDLGGFSRDDAEAKLAQLQNLRRRLDRVGTTPAELLDDAAVDPKVLRKARTKVMQQHATDRDLTKAMRETPRWKLERRARRGHWRRFPIDPSRFEEPLKAIVEQCRFFTEGQSFGLARRLRAAWEKSRKRIGREPGELLALDRAMLTVVHEAHDRTDDSCGVLGELFEEAIRAYFRAPWEASGIAPKVFLRDIVEFTTWEKYGQSDELAEVAHLIAAEHVGLAVDILAETVAEIQSFGLFRYQVEQALALWAEVLAAHRRFEAFVGLAEQIGSDQWKPIVRLGEAAWKAKKPAVALGVFRAANRPGMQRAYLRKRCIEITGREPPRALTVMKGGVGRGRISAQATSPSANGSASKGKSAASSRGAPGARGSKERRS